MRRQFFKTTVERGTHHRQAMKGNSVGSHEQQRRLHRISFVREREGISLRQVRGLLRIGLPELRRQEQVDTDLRLTDLYRWQHALKVPVTELLLEAPEGLSPSLMERTRLVRVMKTALSIAERSNQAEVKCLAKRLIAELNHIIPGLDSVGVWPVVQQRQLKDFGRTLECIVSTQLVDEP